jgi:hypothetical protein
MDSSGTFGKINTNGPKDGYQKVIIDSHNFRHLQVFVNGSWRHDQTCREFTNKDCRRR